MAVLIADLVLPDALRQPGKAGPFDHPLAARAGLRFDGQRGGVMRVRCVDHAS